MKLYIDEDTIDRHLVAMLRAAGHDVEIPTDVGRVAEIDPRQLAYAIQSQRVLLTKNSRDFVALHELVQAAAGRHAGIILIRVDNDTRRDMSHRQVVLALAKLSNAGVPIANECHVLNQWR